MIHLASKEQSMFPVNRWILADDKLCISEFDTSLPFEDKHLEQRAAELERKRALYKLKETVPGAPMQVQPHIYIATCYYWGSQHCFIL